MAAISSLGIGSGLDLGGLVSNLINAERAPVESRLNRQESSLSSDLSGVGQMRSALSQFQSSLAGLSGADSFKNRKLVNSDASAISSSVSNDAALASYAIDVSNIAASQSLASTAYSALDSVIGEGTLQIRFGTITGPGFSSFAANAEKSIQSITVDSSNNTLSGLRDTINAGDYGVTASIINDGSGYRLTLNSNDTGASSAMEITVTDTDGQNTDTSGLSSLAYNTSAQNLTQTRAADDANLTINGLAVSSSTNTLSDVLEGVSLTLNTATTTTVNISVSESTSEISSSVKAMVEGFNSMIQTLNDLGRVDPDTGQDGALAGSAALRTFTFQLRNLLTSPVPGVSEEVRALVDIGITTQADGTLKIDDARFNNAVQQNSFAVLGLFAPVGRASDSLIGFNGSSDATEVGEYAINLTQVASQASLTTAPVLNSFPLTIDANNDDFAVSVDAIASGGLTLTQGSYATGDELATELQLQINSNSLLKDASKSVSVSFDAANGLLLIQSSSFGSTSTISIDSIDTNTAADLGLSVASGTGGVDVAGSIGGVNGTGEGKILTIDSTSDPEGLSIEVRGGVSGDRGTVQFARGMIAQLDALVESYLNSDGVLSSKETEINKALDDLTKQRENLEFRIENMQARLVSQFTALDALVARFQTTGNFLTQQINSLPGFDNLTNRNN